MGHQVCLYCGETLGRYAFGQDHPFGPLRLPAFMEAAGERGLLDRVTMCIPVQASKEAIARFHNKAYIERVTRASELGAGPLDAGDTPAFAGVYEAAATVAGSVLDATARIMDGRCRRAFVPIAGLHHARRDGAAGFCVFNDCGIAIEALLQVHGLVRIAYVLSMRIMAMLFYGFESDPRVIIADVHEDGRYLYPGSGFAEETGKGEGKGSKLNISMPPGADDTAFLASWEAAESFIADHAPQFIIFQCGADSLEGDPITHLAYSSASHRHAAGRLRDLADKLCEGRLLALGGGGYRLGNLSAAWCAVVEAMLE